MASFRIFLLFLLTFIKSDDWTARAVCTSPTLLWSDEFDAATLDTSSWNYFTGTAYNNELEYYTSRPENVRLENGSLVIEARAEAYGGMNYTSARIDTRLKRAFYPGVSVNGTVIPKIRYEARMKLPKGQPFNNQGHYRPTSFNLGLEWHTYAFEWSYNQMWWFIDGMLYYTTHSYSLSDEGWWTSSQTTTPTGPNSPFDAPFYIILNLAVGGDWPRAPDASTVFPSQLLVDYVRVLGYW
ncbi:hypothetical protein VOLCADRAFT_96269 [Volvox carteri f. nagariensis]|uniref:GH16 domain-containing protein n=1 Tax=Volvox carteri f. nagariensis TaxID=3068 RepID=D8U9N7_VOLCA|nr:uncharacterized protein VOLCADRAFT_96269 [Volvox carteri f. nagariensis]EFJ43444.1 hypothetical protein VOLCADRAFT_96269 [Volvox carteri f. nagariensis]|eukprot:XP_002955373.1 hypothetical protein VOLCADRAFT_96269 [Volvox carteri f. nagariensis]